MTILTVMSNMSLLTILSILTIIQYATCPSWSSWPRHWWARWSCPRDILWGKAPRVGSLWRIHRCRAARSSSSSPPCGVTRQSGTFLSLESETVWKHSTAVSWKYSEMQRWARFISCGAIDIRAFRAYTPALHQHKKLGSGVGTVSNRYYRG